MKENEETTEETTEREFTPDVDPGLASVIESVLDARDRAQRDTVERTLAELAQPQRKRHAAILPSSRKQETDGEVRTIVSRNQPTDLLYRRLYRHNDGLKECRTPEIDHWNHQWLLGMIDRDTARVRMAYDKANAAYREHNRATTLEGALDASDPTAILAGTGGSLLSQPFAQVVMIARTASAVIGMLSQEYPMSGATLRIPTAGAATSAKRAEGVATSQGEPTYASVMLRAEALTCYMKASREFIADSPFGAVNVFSQRAGMSIGTAEDVDLCTSDGTHPAATAKIAGGNVDEATSTVLTYPDLSTLYRAVGKAYRGAGCAWLAASDVMPLLDTLVDGDGRPILVNPGATVQPIGDSPGNEGMIFRHPVYEVPLADGTLIFGNIQAGYAVGRREGISVRVSDQASFSAGLVEFMIEERYDAAIQDAAAMKQMAALATVA